MEAFLTLACLVLGTAVVLSATVTPVIRALAVRFSLLDHALTARKIHGQPVPRLGGLAITVGFCGALGVAYLLAGPTFPRAESPKVLGLLVGCLGIAALGVVDDLRGTRAAQKFIVQIVVAGGLFALDFRIEVLAVPFGEPIHLGWLSLPFTLLWVVGITNAFNLIDGLDGLAGGVALIAAVVSLLINLDRGDQTLVLVSVALGGALMGFLPYNLHPASIFMGDTGSLFLGFLLAELAVVSHQKSSTAVAMMVPVTALGLPILDTLLALARRAAHGRPIFRADREHIHHRLLELGLSHREAVLLLYGLSGLFGMTAVVLSQAGSSVTVVMLMGLCTVVYLLLSRLGYLASDARRRTVQDGGGDRALEIAAAARTVRDASGPQEIWQCVKAVSRLLEADAVRLRYLEPKNGGETVVHSYSAGFENPHASLVRARFWLNSGDDSDGFVELAWRGLAARVSPQEQTAVRLVCEGILRARKASAALAAGRAPRGPASVLKLRR